MGISISGGINLGADYGIRISGGGAPPSQPQITVADFSGTTFASFSAGGVGDSFVLPIRVSPSQILGIYYQPTGMETAPDLSSQGVTDYVAVNIGAQTAGQIAASTTLALAPFSAFVLSETAGNAVILTDTTNETITDAKNINLPSPASVTVSQRGHP